MNKFNESDLRILALIYIAAGILLCFFSVDIILTGARILGVILALIGIYFLYLFFVKRISASASPFLIGLPSTAFGIFMAIKPDLVVSFLPIIIGIVFIISSLLTIQKAFVLKDLGFASWKISLIGGILVLIIGISLFFKPIQSIAWVLQFIGLILILYGIFILWNNHTIQKYSK